MFKPAIKNNRIFQSTNAESPDCVVHPYTSLSPASASLQGSLEVWGWVCLVVAVHNSDIVVNLHQFSPPISGGSFLAMWALSHIPVSAHLLTTCRFFRDLPIINKFRRFDSSKPVFSRAVMLKAGPT